MMHLSAESAERVLSASRKKALDIGVPMNIAILDAGGHLKAFLRMDDALLGSIDLSLGKARTSVLFGANSEALFEFCKPGAPAYGLENSNGGLVVFAGGCPLRNAQGELVGAVGVSGGTVPQDKSVAEAGEAAFLTKNT
jgi:uncharacterized protein GlcG (DUF336 family)